MIRELAKYWWLMVLRGVLAIIFAIMAFAWPGITLSFLVVFLGVYFLIDGIFSLIHGFRIRKTDTHWWALVLEGLLGIVAGIVCLSMPGITVIFLVGLVALWSVVTGLLEIILAIRLRKEIQHEWILIIAGVFSVIFGILLFVQPLAGVIVISWWLGLYALFFGIFMITIGARLKKFAER